MDQEKTQLPDEYEIRSSLGFDKQDYELLIEAVDNKCDSENPTIQHKKYHYKAHSVYFLVQDSNKQQILKYNAHKNDLGLIKKSNDCSSKYVSILEEVEN